MATDGRTTEATMAGQLTPAVVESVLDRLGFADRPSVNHEGLAAIYDKWCRRVPFDNCRKLIACGSGDPAPLPGDAPEEFFSVWMQHGVGGTCWAANGALCELLSSLGFDARRGVATMVVAPDLPPNHGTVWVDLDGERYLVDASILHVEPLHVVADQETVIAHPAWGVGGRWLGPVGGDDAKYAVAWRGLHRPDRFDCRVDDWQGSKQDFKEFHELTREWSPFNFALTYNVVRGDGRIGAALGQAVKIDASNDGGLIGEWQSAAVETY